MKNKTHFILLLIVLTLIVGSFFLPIDEDSQAQLNKLSIDSEKSDFNTPGTEVGGDKNTPGSPGPMNNLRVSDVRYGHNPLYDYIGVDVFTSGPVPSNPNQSIELKFYVDGQLTNTTNKLWSNIESSSGKFVDTAYPTGAFTYQNGLSIIPGPHSMLKACIDTLNILPEIDETDNCTEFKMGVAEASFKHEDGSDPARTYEVDVIGSESLPVNNFQLIDVSYDSDLFTDYMKTEVSRDGPGRAYDSNGVSGQGLYIQFYVDGQLTNAKRVTWQDIPSGTVVKTSSFTQSDNGNQIFDNGLSIIPGPNSMLKACIDANNEWQEYDESDNCIEFQMSAS